MGVMDSYDVETECVRVIEGIASPKEGPLLTATVYLTYPFYQFVSDRILGY